MKLPKLPSSLVGFLKEGAISTKTRIQSVNNKFQPQAPSKSPSHAPVEFRPTRIRQHTSFYKKPTSSTPIHAQINKLPALSTDIKGVDSIVHRLANRNSSKRGIPKLIQGKHFSLRFFPESHLFSMARKSNVAYMFTNTTYGSIFNDPKLSASFKNYNGKYKKHIFFRKHMNPLSSAVNRVLFRRMVKRGLFESISKQVPASSVGKVRGVFQFKLFIFPSTQEEKKKLQSDISVAIKKLVEEKVKFEYKEASPAERESFKKTLKSFRLPGEQNVRGYFPRLPFMNGRTKSMPTTKRNAR